MNQLVLLNARWVQGLHLVLWGINDNNKRSNWSQCSEGREIYTRKAMSHPRGIHEFCRWHGGAKNGMGPGLDRSLCNQTGQNMCFQTWCIYQVLLCFWHYVNFPSSPVPHFTKLQRDEMSFPNMYTWREAWMGIKPEPYIPSRASFIRTNSRRGLLSSLLSPRVDLYSFKCQEIGLKTTKFYLRVSRSCVGKEQRSFEGKPFYFYFFKVAMLVCVQACTKDSNIERNSLEFCTAF